MNEIELKLSKNYPRTSERIEGQLVYLEKYGISKLDSPKLSTVLSMNFYKANFSTGYRKFQKIDIVVGFQDQEIYLLLTPLFSDKYSTLTKQFEQIEGERTNTMLISEIVQMFRETRTNITEIDAKNYKYQIWFGEIKWRILKFKIDTTLKIITEPNKRLKNLSSWLKLLFRTK